MSAMRKAGYSLDQELDLYASRLSATTGTTGSGAVVLATGPTISGPTISSPTITDVNGASAASPNILIASSTAGLVEWANPFYAMVREICMSARYRLGWYSARYISGQDDGDPVATWSDLSGLGNDLTQGTANAQPTYKTNIVNGHPVVRFEDASTGDYLNMPDMFDGDGITGVEAFVVIKIDADPPGAVEQSGLWDIGADTTNTHFPFTDSNVYDSFGTTVRKSTGNPTLDLSSAFRVYNVVSRSAEWTSRIDGTQHYTTGTNTVGFTTAPTFGRSNNSTYFLDGDVAELIFLDTSVAALPSTLRDIITAYLMFEYGL